MLFSCCPAAVAARLLLCCVVAARRCAAVAVSVLLLAPGCSPFSGAVLARSLAFLGRFPPCFRWRWCFCWCVRLSRASPLVSGLLWLSFLVRLSALFPRPFWGFVCTLYDISCAVPCRCVLPVYARVSCLAAACRPVKPVCVCVMSQKSKKKYVYPCILV